MKLRILLTFAMVAVAIPTISAIAQEPVCPIPAEAQAPDLAFAPPTYIDETRAGGEPVSIVAQDGSLIVSAHAGTTHVYKNPDALPGARDFLVDYSNQTIHWRSVDGGKSWKKIGLFGDPEGPHTAQSSGFSDPDLAMDLGGRIYDVEINLANDAVFSSVDDGQSWPHGNPFPAGGDRPWLTALEANEIYLYVNAYPKSSQISRDGGLTWTKYANLGPPITSKAVRDPLNPEDGMIGPVDLGRFAISANDGQTWATHNFGQLGQLGTQFFGTVGVDNAGNVYQAKAGGYSSNSDIVPNGQVSFTYYERATGNVNEDVIIIPTPPGDALWPWIMAGDDGRVAVVWYQNHAGDPSHFYTYIAYTHNAHGTTVTCSDGTEQLIPPQFTVVNASGRPVHEGRICLNGTTCNANPDFEGGDRRLGDFFTVNFDNEGRLFIVSADTMLNNRDGGAKPVGNPIFIKQTTGDRMIETPIVNRPTRPLCYNPVTCV